MTAIVLTRTEPTRDVVYATLVTAFTSDPIIRWLYPDPQRYLQWFPRLLDLAGGTAFTTASADHQPGGAALWVSPGTETPEEPLVQLFTASIDPRRHEAVFGFFAQVLEHHPDQPHWYLPFIGVEPNRQGHGLGTAILRTGLQRCDDAATPAYLEASSPRNRRLYEQHGFIAAAEIQSGDSPPLWPMWRAATRQEEGT
ncbi:MAG TPA: GNAT family N-acetyltransferase [Egibacteraceae bacterium]|nr:GNAT family N-acetyltransferase [Egibacteraceae bacterium]